MIQISNAFRTHFSSFVRAGGRWRDAEPDALLNRWAVFIESCERGYPSDAEDYFNDLTSRNSLDDALMAEELQKYPELAELRSEVEALDARFRAILVADAFPRMPKQFWWTRGVVKYAKRRLVEDLRSGYCLNVLEIK
jgi:hypothetical protein